MKKVKKLRGKKSPSRRRQQYSYPSEGLEAIEKGKEGQIYAKRRRSDFG